MRCQGDVVAGGRLRGVVLLNGWGVGAGVIVGEAHWRCGGGTKSDGGK